MFPVSNVDSLIERGHPSLLFRMMYEPHGIYSCEPLLRTVLRTIIDNDILSCLITERLSQHHERIPKIRQFITRYDDNTCIHMHSSIHHLPASAAKSFPYSRKNARRASSNPSIPGLSLLCAHNGSDCGRTTTCQ